MTGAEQKQPIWPVCLTNCNLQKMCCFSHPQIIRSTCILLAFPIKSTKDIVKSVLKIGGIQAARKHILIRRPLPSQNTDRSGRLCVTFEKLSSDLEIALLLLRSYFHCGFYEVVKRIKSEKPTGLPQNSERWLQECAEDQTIHGSEGPG